MKKGLFRISALLSLACAFTAGGMLFSVSQRVHKAENRLDSIKRRIEHEKEAIRILDAEWAYLNHPARLENLARRHLEMEDPAPECLLSGAEDLSEYTLPEHPPRKPDAPGKSKVRVLNASAAIFPSRLPVPAISSRQDSKNQTSPFTSRQESGYSAPRHEGPGFRDKDARRNSVETDAEFRSLINSLNSMEGE